MKMAFAKHPTMRMGAAFLAVLAAGSCSDAKETSSLVAEQGSAGRSVFVSVTEKGATSRFLNRLATPTAQIVVTRTAVAGARESHQINLNGAERLMLVELQKDTPAILPGERLRFDGAAIVAVPASMEPHEFLGSHRIHAEDIANRETVQSAAAVDQGIGGAIDAAQAAFALERGSIDIDVELLKARLNELSGVIPVTVDGRTFTISERRSTEGRANARAWLKQEYERIGFTVSEHRYGSGISAGVNFIAEKAGSEAGRFVLLTSHLDSVGNAGADDNGAGTVSNLAIVTALQNNVLRYGLRIVAFDQEENGLVGSAAYAKSLSTSNRLSEVVGVLNLEMTGYDSDGDGAFHAMDCNENTSASLTRLITDVVARDPLRLRHVAACTNRSDHASFWRYNLPAIVISENFFGGDGNPCYHKACDKVDQMDFDYMRRLTTAVGRATAALVVAP